MSPALGPVPPRTDYDGLLAWANRALSLASSRYMPPITRRIIAHFCADIKKERDALQAFQLTSERFGDYVRAIEHWLSTSEWVPDPRADGEQHGHQAAHGCEQDAGPNGVPHYHCKVFSNWRNFRGDEVGYARAVVETPGLPHALAPLADALMRAALRFRDAFDRGEREEAEAALSSFNERAGRLIRKITSTQYSWDLEPSGELHSTTSGAHSLGRRSALLHDVNRSAFVARANGGQW